MKALYYNVKLEATEFDILQDHGDTVDIGTGETVVVRGAPVVSAPKEGCVIRVHDSYEV